MLRSAAEQRDPFLTWAAADLLLRRTCLAATLHRVLPFFFQCNCNMEHTVLAAEKQTGSEP